MRRLLRILFTTAAALGAVVVAYVVISLPPAPRKLDVSVPPTTVFGAYHVHSSRSDGGGTADEIAAAAARAGLAFVILTDHGDATRMPDPPQYRHGVLCVDAVEISTTDGHLVALGLNAAAPYPLGGESRDVLEDVHRLGGWAVAAHPDSPKADQRWRGNAPIDGIEWLNADSEWRDERPLALLRAAGHYLFRPAAAIATVFDRPTASLRRWDAANRQRPTVGLAAVDAHARIGWDERDEPRTAHTILARPTYEDMFRTVGQAVRLDRPFTGDGLADAAALLQALGTRRTYSVVSALAAPAVLDFTATQGGVTHSLGAEIDATGEPLVFAASVPALPDATLVILRDGRDVAGGLGRVRYEADSSSGVYRAEARLPGAAVPWITTNAIVVGSRPDRRPAEATIGPRRLESLHDPARWVLEKHEASVGTVSIDGGEVRLSYRLAPGRRSGQYAALVHPLPGADSFDRITFTIRADRPMRVSVQVRLPGAGDGERWLRSVYVDQTPRAVELPLQEFEPVGLVTSRRPIVARVQSLLFVVDAPNTPPGGQGSVWVSRVALGGPVTLGATSGR